MFESECWSTFGWIASNGPVVEVSAAKWSIYAIDVQHNYPGAVQLVAPTPNFPQSTHATGLGQTTGLPTSVDSNHPPISNPLPLHLIGRVWSAGQSGLLFELAVLWPFYRWYHVLLRRLHGHPCQPGGGLDHGGHGQGGLDRRQGRGVRQGLWPPQRGGDGLCHQQWESGTRAYVQIWPDYLSLQASMSETNSRRNSFTEEVKSQMSSRKSSASSSRRQSSSSVIMSRRGSYSVVKEELEEERQSPQGVAELEISLRQQLEEQNKVGQVE